MLNIALLFVLLMSHASAGDDGVVAFTAELSQDTDLSGEVVIIFDRVVTNEGGRYFDTSGQFVCTDDDLYVFVWNVRKASAGGQEGMRCITKLRKGGMEYKYGPKTDYHSTYYSGTTQMSAALQCSTDVPTAITVMTVPWAGGSTARFRGYNGTSFSGFRLESSVAFTVELSEEQRLIEGSRLRFKNIVSNFGEYYDPVNQFFRCPDDGLYVFTVTAHNPDPSSPWSVSRLMMEDQVVLQGPITYVATEAYDSGTSSITAVLQCSQNSSVYVEAQASHDFIYNSYGAQLTTFTGFKLYDVISGAVAFTAVMTANQTVQSGRQPLLFDETITNIGNAFDTSLSRFVCPDDDFYMFSWSLAAVGGPTHCHGDLYMDDIWRVELALTTESAEGGTSGTGAQSVILQCKAGSVLQVKAREASDSRVYIGGFASFSGYKIPGAW